MESVTNMNMILKSAPTSPAKYNWDRDITGSPIAKLVGKDFEYIMRQKRVVIGRHSSTHGDVDINMGHSSFVSRKHIEILFENSHFYFKCEGKNGIFVDGEFQRKSNIPMTLPCRCCFRFPSTQIKIMYESLIDEFNPPLAVPSRPPSPHRPKQMPKTSSFTPLEICIPEQGLYYRSPAPSPTGTISAANSCPTSPRSAGLSGRYHMVTPTESSGGGSLSAAAAAATSSSAVDCSVQYSGGGIVAASECNNVEMMGGMHTSASFSNMSDTSFSSDWSAAPYVVPNEVTVNSAMADAASYSPSLAAQPSPSGSSSNDGSGLLSSPLAAATAVPVQTPLAPPSGVSSAATKPSSSDKPPYSYAQLIIQAIAASPQKQLTLSGIYSFIISQYPYYSPSDKGWQNSIRHNLSLNRYFMKVPRSQDEPGKGSFWRIEELSEDKLLSQAFKKRRNRGIPGFRPPYSAFSLASSRSAPSSPIADRTGNGLSPAAAAGGVGAVRSSVSPLTCLPQQTAVGTNSGVITSYTGGSSTTVPTAYQTPFTNTNIIRVIRSQATVNQPAAATAITTPTAPDMLLPSSLSAAAGVAAAPPPAPYGSISISGGSMQILQQPAPLTAIAALPQPQAIILPPSALPLPLPLSLPSSALPTVTSQLQAQPITVVSSAAAVREGGAGTVVAGDNNSPVLITITPPPAALQPLPFSNTSTSTSSPPPTTLHQRTVTSISLSKPAPPLQPLLQPPATAATGVSPVVTLQPAGMMGNPATLQPLVAEVAPILQPPVPAPTATATILPRLIVTALAATSVPPLSGDANAAPPCTSVLGGGSSSAAAAESEQGRQQLPLPPLQPVTIASSGSSSTQQMPEGVMN